MLLQLPYIYTSTFNSSSTPAPFGTKGCSFEISQSGEHRKKICLCTAMTQHIPLANFMHIRCVALKHYTWSYCVKYRLQIHRIEPPRFTIQGSQLELHIWPLAPVTVIGKEGRRCGGSWMAGPKLLMQHLVIYNIGYLLMFDPIPHWEFEAVKSNYI